MEPSRYQKQILFRGLGLQGQEALERSSVLIAGCGALGGSLAILLARAGVGKLRLVDQDAPERSNLHRQLLFLESDLGTGRSKAELAAERLAAANSEVVLEPITTRIGPDNVLELCQGMDLILDGLDNQFTRYLLNEAAVALNRPYVYAGCVAGTGSVMAIVPGQTPCFKCLFPTPSPPEALPACDTVGILGPTAAMTASLAAAEAMKLMAGAPQNLPARMITFDIWQGVFRTIEMDRARNRDCPCCGGRQFEFIGSRS